MWGRFGARWTPTILVLDPRGREQHRIEGFLPTDMFLAQLEFGLGLVAVAQKDWKDAEHRFTRVLNEFPNTEAAPAALYWAGVARYSATRDAKPLQETARAFETRYANTSWAQRASVWKPTTPGKAAA